MHNVLEHSLSTIVGEKYACLFCEKKFARLAAYRAHLQTHTVIESLICAICKEEFDYQVNLQLIKKIRVRVFAVDASQRAENGNASIVNFLNSSIFCCRHCLIGTCAYNMMSVMTLISQQ